MARRPMTPARRKRRTIRMAIALPILLAVLVLVLDYPILTAGQALRATQKRYFFGPGEVLTSIDFSRGYNKFKIGQSDRYYILRWGGLVCLVQCESLRPLLAKRRFGCRGERPVSAPGTPGG